MLELPGLQLATALLTAGAALTLVPHSRRPVGSAIELLVWIGFVLSSVLCIATFGNPKIHEATAAIAWGAFGLMQVQASFAVGAVGAWTAAHRFVIGNWVVLVAGLDVFALVLIASLRSARRAAPRIHLAEWFELPYPVAQPAFVPAADPLAGIDRRLAAAMRQELDAVKGGLETSPALATAAVRTAHILRPGHLRLTLVKLALNIRWRRESLAHPASPAAKRSRRRTAGHLDAGRWTPAPQPRGRASASTKKNKEDGRGGNHGFRQRVAS